jgi:hypothetical protein
MMPQGRQAPPEDSEQSHSQTEGGGISRFGIMLAAACFACAILWATLESRRVWLWRWFYRGRLLVNALKFLRNASVNQSNKNQTTQTKLRSADALRTDPERNP